MKLLALASALASAQPSTAPAVSTAAVEVSSPPIIQVNYPEENAQFANLQATYILGNVQPPDALLSINGRPVPVHKKGGFLAYVPVQPGDFAFRLEAAKGSQYSVYERKVRIEPPVLSAATTTAAVDGRSVQPAADLHLRAGDWVRVAARGPSGMTGRFRIFHVRKNLPLVETQWGLYEGAYQLRPQDEAESETIRLFFEGPPGGFQADAPGRLTVLRDSPQVAVLQRDTYEFNNVRGAPGRGYKLFLPNGVKALVTGRVGDEARLEFAGGVVGWLPWGQLKLLPPGTPPPRAVLGTLEASSAPRLSRLKLSLSEQVPFAVEEEPGRVRLLLFDTDAHTNWIHYDAADPNIREIRWMQDADGVARVDVWLSTEAALMGTHLAYAAGSLELELRWPLPAPPKGESPLAGTIIVLDPGHSPSDPGRVGPLGHTERAHNLRTALALKALLEKEGASVVLTRLGDEEVNLQQRLDIAWQNRGDALISLHNNALPEGQDPYAAERGFSVFYFHAHSRALAERIHRAYQKSVPLADEGLKFADLFIPRTTRLPAVLLESAYFIFPEQEQLLLDDAFQGKLAKALLTGLKEFFKDVRKGKPAPKKEEEKPAPPAPKAEEPKKAPSAEKKAQRDGKTEAAKPKAAPAAAKKPAPPSRKK